MTIDHLAPAIFTRNGTPATRGHAGSCARRDSSLGLLRIRMDEGHEEGHEGHAFLGPAIDLDPIRRRTGAILQ